MTKKIKLFPPRYTGPIGNISNHCQSLSLLIMIYKKKQFLIVRQSFVIYAK